MMTLSLLYLPTCRYCTHLPTYLLLQTSDSSHATAQQSLLNIMREVGVALVGSDSITYYT